MLSINAKYLEMKLKIGKITDYFLMLHLCKIGSLCRLEVLDLQPNVLHRWMINIIYEN